MVRPALSYRTVPGSPPSTPQPENAANPPPQASSCIELPMYVSERQFVCRGNCRSSHNDPGANWFRPDDMKYSWRAVVDQLATLKADHILRAESNLSLAA